MLYPMPSWNYTDTLTIRPKHSKTDSARGLNPVYAPTGPTIPANIARAIPVLLEFAQRSGTTMQVTFTTPDNPTFTDPAGVVRKIGKGDMLVQGSSGREWIASGELDPRLGPDSDDVHYWGVMEKNR